jgi:hypothetical protein
MGLAVRVQLRTGFWFIWESGRDDLTTLDEVREALGRGEALPGLRLVLEKLTYSPEILGLDVEPGDDRRVRLVAREVPWEMWPETAAKIEDPYFRVARMA